MTARSAVLIRLWKGHHVEMDDALNECPYRDGKCPIYIMGDEDQNPTGFLMCDHCGAIGDDPTFIASVRTSA